MKQIQIPYELFVDLLKYHCFEYTNDEAVNRIKNGLESKLNSLVKRELYTKAKTAETAEEREQARLAYLDKIGVPDEYRY